MTRSEGDTWDLASTVGATATMVAAGRALATKDSRGLINDPFAQPLVEAVGLDFFTKQVRGELDVSAMDPAAVAFVQSMVDSIAVRTKYFDQYFADATAAGIRQVVIFASGLDARAYRLAWPAGTVVYEIDQPQVISLKTAALADLGAKPIAEHRTVAIDLRDDWPAALRAAGLDTTTPTAWSAEGLLQYLPSDARHMLLENVTRLSAVGSNVAADDNVADPTQAASGAVDIWRAMGFDLDMPSLMFTAERGDVSEYLAKLGWQVDRRPIDDVFAAYRVERSHSTGAHPLDAVAYVSGTLHRPPSTD